MSVNITAPMSGVVWKIHVTVGEEVAEDDELLILEALKMENPIYAQSAGKVVEIKVKEEDQVKPTMC